MIVHSPNVQTGWGPREDYQDWGPVSGMTHTSIGVTPQFNPSQT